MSGGPCSGVSLPGPPGVRRAARVHGLGRNRRDPSAWPASGKDRRYKPMVKSGGGQRESEGAVVPVIGVQHKAPGGKGPHFDHAWDEGKRQGMAGPPGPNTPVSLSWPYCGDKRRMGGRPSATCGNFSAGYGLRPSSLRSGVSTPCMTVFTGVTSCGRRGNGSGVTVGRPGWIASPWRMWRTSTGCTGCSVNSSAISAKVVTVPRLPGAWISRNHKAARGRKRIIRLHDHAAAWEQERSLLPVWGA